MNINEGNKNDLFNETLYALKNWSARRAKSCDCMTSMTITIITYLFDFY